MDSFGQTESVPVDALLLETVRRKRCELATRGPSALRSTGDFEYVTLPERDGDALRDLLVAENARFVIEIGLAYGSSALAVAEALVSLGRNDAVHLIIDAFQDHFHDSGWQAIVDSGLTDICSLERDRSQLVLPRFAADGVVADAAFVDGSHIFHNVFVDLYFLRELVRPGGLIVLDDCDWPSVATAVRYFEVNTGWQAHRLDTDTRLRAYRLPDPRVDRGFEQFVPFGLDPTA